MVGIMPEMYIIWKDGVLDVDIDNLNIGLLIFLLINCEI
jgi:hypothetical protein